MTFFTVRKILFTWDIGKPMLSAWRALSSEYSVFAICVHFASYLLLYSLPGETVRTNNRTADKVAENDDDTSTFKLNLFRRIHASQVSILSPYAFPNLQHGCVHISSRELFLLYLRIYAKRQVSGKFLLLVVKKYYYLIREIYGKLGIYESASERGVNLPE